MGQSATSRSTSVRARGGRHADVHEPDQHRSDGRRIGRDQRRDGRLRHPVSARPDPHDGVPVHLRTRIVVPAYLMLGYWFLLQLLGGSAAQRRGRGRVLGARRRLRRRCAAHLGVQGRRSSWSSTARSRGRWSRSASGSGLPRRRRRMAPGSSRGVCSHLCPTRCPWRESPSLAAPFDVPVAPRNPGMPLELDWVRGGAGQPQRRRAARGHAAHPANGQEGVAGGVAAPRHHADGPDDAVRRRHARPGAPALRQGPPAGARGPARGDGRDPAADQGRRGLRLPHVRRHRGGRARGLGHSGRRGVDRVPGGALAVRAADRRDPRLGGRGRGGDRRRDHPRARAHRELARPVRRGARHARGLRRRAHQDDPGHRRARHAAQRRARRAWSA